MNNINNMRGLLLIVLLIISFSSFAQKLTLEQKQLVREKFELAKISFSNEDFTSTLIQIDEIEKEINYLIIPTCQLLKVKALAETNSFKKAKAELKLLKKCKVSSAQKLELVEVEKLINKNFQKYISALATTTESKVEEQQNSEVRSQKKLISKKVKVLIENEFKEDFNNGVFDLISFDDASKKFISVRSKYLDFITDNKHYFNEAKLYGEHELDNYEKKYLACSQWYSILYEEHKINIEYAKGVFQRLSATDPNIKFVGVLWQDYSRNRTIPVIVNKDGYPIHDFSTFLNYTIADFFLELKGLNINITTNTFKDGNKWGVKGKDGRIIFPAEYLHIGNFYYGKTYALKSKNEIHIISIDGEVLQKRVFKGLNYKKYLNFGARFFPEHIFFWGTNKDGIVHFHEFSNNLLPKDYSSTQNSRRQGQLFTIRTYVIYPADFLLQRPDDYDRTNWKLTIINNLISSTFCDYKSYKNSYGYSMHDRMNYYRKAYSLKYNNSLSNNHFTELARHGMEFLEQINTPEFNPVELVDLKAFGDIEFTSLSKLPMKNNYRP